MQHVMGIAVQGGGEASESSGSDYGSTLFSHDSHSKGSQYSGFTTPGSTEDANRKIQAAQALAEKNVELMKLGPYAAVTTTDDANESCNHFSSPDQYHTCPHPYHSSYNEGNLPLLLFRLEPPENHHQPQVEPLMENGQVVLDFQGNSVRNFPFLPRYISVRPSGWLIEFWMRSDTRLTYRDIKARMSAAKEDLPSDNVLNMRRERDARKPLGLSCWTARRGGVTKAEIERIEQLSAENVAYNTALKIQRGTESVMLESKSFYPNDTPHYYPVNIFLDSGEEVHTPGQRLDVCIQLLFDLQVLATDLGFDDWRDLPDYRLPTWWTKVRAKVDGEQTNARKSEHYSKTGSAMSTPKAAPRTRMSWKTPRRTHTSAIPSVQTPVGVITPLNTPSSVTPQSAPRFNGTSMGLAGHSYHHFPAYGLNESHGLHQGYQYSSWGPQHLQSSPISDITYQSSDVDMMLDDSPIRLNPIQEQTHFALAAVTNTQANVNDYLGMDDPFLDEVPYLHSSVDYNNFLGNMAMQIFEHQQAAGYPEFSNTQGLGMQRFNGHKGFSIRENAAHKLNINTDIIMDRSNPFGMLQDFDSKQPMSPKRSFEEFLVEDLPF